MQLQMRLEPISNLSHHKVGKNNTQVVPKYFNDKNMHSHSVGITMLKYFNGVQTMASSKNLLTF